MHYSENIGKIRRFFTEEKNHDHKEYISDFDKILKCKALALLLINSKLATPELNRYNVNLLLEGKLAWPKNDGSMYRIDTGIELSLLEDIGAITFYTNYCEIHSRSISDYDAISDSAKPIYDSLKLLKNILYGNGFIRPHFHINKKFAHDLIENNSLLIKLDRFQGVVSEGDNYRIDLDDFRHHNLLPEFLWEEIVASMDLNKENIETNYSEIVLNKAQMKSLNKWLLICRVYSDNYLAYIDFKYIKHKEESIYLNFFESLVINDTQLKQPKYTLINRWICSSNFEDVFFEVDRSIHMHISSSGESNISHTQQPPTPLSIDEVKSKIFMAKEVVVEASNLELARDWARHVRHTNNDNMFYSIILSQFIKSDIFIDNISINSYGRLDNLLEKSTEREELRHIILNELPSYSGIKYLLYLLTKKDTATTALYLFADRVIYNSIDLPHTEYDTYHLKYFPIICDEFLELSFKSKFDKLPDKDIVEVLIFMADDSIFDNYSGEFICKKDCLDILLKRFSTEQVSYFSECLFSEIKKSIAVTDTKLPASKVYLLFWLLEKSQDFYSPNKSDSSNKIQSLITELYISVFRNNIGNKDNTLDAYKLFDYLPWWRIDDEYIPNILRLINNPANWALKLAKNNSCPYQNKRLTRSYLQLLIGLLSEKRVTDKNELITLKVLGLLESCGFPENANEFYGLFDYEFKYSFPLWQQFILIVDDMSDGSFNRVLSILESGTPINLVLELYEKVNKEARKAKILVHITSSSEETIDDLGIATLEESLDSACRTGQVDIAKVMLDKGLFLLNDEDSYLRKRLPSTQISILEDKWRSYEFKITLLMIVSDDSLSNEEKLERIQGYEQPFRKEKNHQLKLNLAGSCNRFQRHMSALITHETDPEKSYNYFNSLYREDKTVYYSGNRFASKLAHLDKSESSENIDYKNTLDEWLRSIDDSDIQVVDCNFIKNWFHCLIKNNDLRGIDALWDKLSITQQNNISIVTCYCKSLKQRGEYYSANLIFENLKKYHNVTSLGDEAEKQWCELSEMIINDQEPTLIASFSKGLAEKPKSTNELRRSYHEIFSKKLNEVISIVDKDGSTIENFLYENVFSIVEELQLRKTNLNKSDYSRNKISRRIIKEDSINDWLTSLFDHKLSYLGLSCHDQKRGGQSSSKENPGEIDFFLCGKNSDRIAIIEAFRLFSNDTAVINSHLNKVSGYDQQCLSPVFIIAYCDVNDFSILCDNYHHDSKEREYNGFEKSSSQEYMFRNIENSSTIKTYKETRFRGGKPITIYHFMVNLRFDS